ncbi:MAG: hypothetical protein RQ739_12180 [Desulfotignum sp.]|nr:hypothetical protein [Desulfotignum sp.]
MNQARSGHKPMMLIGVIVVAVLLLIAYFFLTADKDPASGDKAAPAQYKSVPDKTLSLSQTSGPRKTDSTRVVKKPVARQRVFEYDNLNGDTESGRVMRQRLQEMGIKKSLDMILRSDESIKIDDRTLSMQDILEKASAEKQIIHETRITEFEATELEQLHNYGIYVVQPGDNIWNIHFNILKEYYASRGIHVAYDADEPLNTGYASGVGKILKFSEIMVTIYNIIEEKVVTEIDLIEPLSKLVIYNLDDVFELLSDVDLEQVDQIRFDGSTLWIPAQET